MQLSGIVNMGSQRAILFQLNIPFYSIQIFLTDLVFYDLQKRVNPNANHHKSIINILS